MSENNTNELAEKIARLLQAETPSNDFSALHRRLDKIESQITSQNLQPAFRDLLSNHPSQQKFEIAEAVTFDSADQFETEKACPYEPTGKPCDHCAMCNSRGF